MITSITLPVVVIVALIGCCFTQKIEVPDGKCNENYSFNKRGPKFNHTTHGGCKIYGAQNTPGRSCEMEVECKTDKMEVCPKDLKLEEYTKWEVDLVDVPNHYVCIIRQWKYFGSCYTYLVCFYDQIEANLNWDCMFAMKVNRYQQSTENSFDFETIEIKISYADDNDQHTICKPTTLFALTTPNRDEISVISNLDHEEINWAEDFTDSALISALVKNLNVTQKNREDKIQASCYDWMVGLGSVVVALFLVGVLAIVLALQLWKRTSPRRVAVPVCEENLMSEMTGREVIDGADDIKSISTRRVKESVTWLEEVDGKKTCL